MEYSRGVILNCIAAECPYCVIEERDTCAVYQYPITKWLNGRRCPMAPPIKVEKAEKHVDPIKASKKLMGKKGK